MDPDTDFPDTDQDLLMIRIRSREKFDPHRTKGPAGGHI